VCVREREREKKRENENENEILSIRVFEVGRVSKGLLNVTISRYLNTKEFELKVICFANMKYR
jgi:hypothetical protein